MSCKQLGLFEAINSTEELLAVAIALGARTISGWSEQEEQLARGLPCASEQACCWVQDQIDKGNDALGDLFMTLLSSEERRPRGATYTPQPIIDSMLTWARDRIRPRRIVDPGTGSGRFLVSASLRFSEAELFGVESDPTAAILARGNLAARRLGGRSKILVADYRNACIKPIEGSTFVALATLPTSVITY